MWKFSLISVLPIAGVLLLLIPIRQEMPTWTQTARAPYRDLSALSTEPPSEPLDMVFLHHSVGARMLASEALEHGDPRLPNLIPTEGAFGSSWNARGTGCIRRRTEVRWLNVPTSSIGFPSSVTAWTKSSLSLTRTLGSTPGSATGSYLFKSCFPNSNFISAGSPPGTPQGPELTVANARAAMLALLVETGRHPDVLFVYLTAPPQAPGARTQPAWKWLAKKVLGRQSRVEELRRSGDLAREFNNWMRDPNGWLSGYSSRNVVVFDLFDTLTGHGQSNLSRYPTWDGADSHPSAEGNAIVAAELVPFLNRAVRYAGVVP